MSTEHRQLRKVTVDLASNRHIRQQHELLHQLVRVALCVVGTPDGPPRLLVEPERDLGLVQPDGARAESLLAQGPCQFMQSQDGPLDRVDILPVVDGWVVGGGPVQLRVLNYSLCPLVGQLDARSDHRAPKPLRDHLAFVVKLPDHGEGESIFVLGERAQVFAQEPWQHGVALVDQISRGGPFTRDVVKIRLGLEKEGHIGNMHSDLISSTLKAIERQRVVQVTGCRRIDRENARVAEIAPRRNLLLRDVPLAVGVERRERLENLGWKVRIVHPVLGQDDLHLSLDVADFAHDCSDLSVGVAPLQWPLCNLSGYEHLGELARVFGVVGGAAAMRAYDSRHTVVLGDEEGRPLVERPKQPAKGAMRIPPLDRDNLADGLNKQRGELIHREQVAVAACQLELAPVGGSEPVQRHHHAGLHVIHAADQQRPIIVYAHVLSFDSGAKKPLVDLEHLRRCERPALDQVLQVAALGG
mmetsp:Transcript_28345/g.74409  ORF Transcript_28345/g.74409 Transcript_28345/m.74409 type:complete len:471 (-) Transcript_28345:526-1938(-)